MIINLGANKFLKAEDYTGLNGIWIPGKGVFFDTKEEALTFHKNSAHPNWIYDLFTEEYQGKTYYAHCPVNSYN